jgi:hypothetical protein
LISDENTGRIKMKTVTIHQPNYLPWIGFFSKAKHADCLILTDIHPFTKGSVTHRNKIRIKEGWGYLTIPINKKFYNSRICDVELPQDKMWKKDHWLSILHNYKKAEFFSPCQSFFERLYENDFVNLGQLNREIILYLLECLKINVPVVMASDLNVAPELQKTDLLVALLKDVGADVYLSGPSGRNYLEVGQFPQNNIVLKYFKFHHPVYQQRYPGFEPEMSVIDLLFNLGPQASDIIDAAGSIED